MLYTREHIEIQETTRRFVKEHIDPNVQEWDKDGIFPARELFKKMGDLGLLGISKPEAAGGLGLDYSYSVAFSEAMGSSRCGFIPMAVGVQTDMATPALAIHGSKELHEQFLAPAVAGDQVACVAVSEPGAGSDVVKTTTHARKDGDDYVINGQKMWITNGTQADWACMLVNTNPEAESPYRSKSLIVVPLDSKGVDRSTKLDKMSMRGSDTAIIHLDEVRVPQRNLIGEEGMGFIYQMQQFQEERMCLTAAVLEAMEGVINETIEYAGQRKLFGGTVLSNQVVQFRLAELQTEVEALRALLYRAVEEYVGGGNVLTLASMAKLKGGRLVREVTDACLQYWGGQGLMEESLVAQQYRDLRLTAIGGGADEVMLQIIAKQMGTFSR